MLTVDFKETYGYAYVDGTRTNEDGTQENCLIKCNIHPANCLGAVIYHGEEDDRLVWFFVDKDHVKSMHEHGDLKEVFKKVEMNTFYGNTATFRTLIKYLTMSNVDVSLYYEEQKKSTGE